MLNYGSSDGIDPVLLLLLGIGDEVHGVGARGELERELLVQHVLRAFHCEASGDGDHAARPRSARDVRLLEPEELSLLQHEPAAPPRLDVLALLR